MSQTVPLSKLVRSANKIRSHDSEESVRQLAADIHARGLLQNLVVEPVARSRGAYGVLIGGRRLAALEHLARQKRLARTHPVAVKILDLPAGLRGKPR